jgi:hypothetical protein
MKILLVHPLDTADVGPWTDERWDLIVDLGKNGLRTHEQWRNHFNCDLQALDFFRNGFSDFYQIRELLGRGCRSLVDEFGLDWWEILSILLHEEVEVLVLLQRLARTFGPSDEVHISRPSLHADILYCLLAGHIRIFRPRFIVQKGLTHYFRAVARLSASQIIDILGDKYDPAYQFRGRLTGKRAASSRPSILVPTAYVNGSRTGLDYAKTFSEQDFLLVTTRQSGWVDAPPRNVRMARLSSYASSGDHGAEDVHLDRRLRLLLTELCRSPEFEILNRLGHLSMFPSRLQHGIKVRDAWRNVLDHEPVQGVLCTDDSNPYTRIPLLLARERGLPSIACHHGALDGRYVFKRSYGSTIWVKGEMERDYLVNKCKVPAERVEICAPALSLPSDAHESPSLGGQRPYIVFFSEQYENLGGRAEGFYQDTVPALADLALATGRKLVVKLHPAESAWERTRTLIRTISETQLKAVQVVSGPLTEDLLAKTWFGVTVLSTVSMECTVRGIPCFLCKWLEPGGYEYVAQFTHFGAGIALNGPGDIVTIPQYMQTEAVAKVSKRHLWQTADKDRLKTLLAPKALT